MNLEEICRKISPPDARAAETTKKRWDAIAHPLHSLGKMERLVSQIAGIRGSADADCKKKALIVMCADNGVVEEGVTQCGQEVTAIVSENFLHENATVAILCRETGADIFPVDIGIAKDTALPNYKIAYGTKNFAKESAMTRMEALRAIETGIDMVRTLSEQGYQIIATGEMGIGNTTTSSAVVSVLLSQAPETVTGHGAGLSEEGLQTKVRVIKEAIALHRPDKKDPVDVLAKVGGFDIAGLAGVFLGGALYRIPIVIDGFISGAAALTAARICPAAADYMIASHMSKEPATHMVLNALGKEACLTLDMCLGEGSGAVTLFPILDMAFAVYHKMSTFSDNAIEEYEDYEKEKATS